MFQIKRRWSKITCKEVNCEKVNELKGAAKDLVETCMIDEKAILSGRCHIANTHIAANAEISPKSTITNCVIMSGVLVGEKLVTLFIHCCILTLKKGNWI